MIILHGQRLTRESVVAQGLNQETETEIEIAEGCTTVGTALFSGMPNLRRVVTPESLGNWQFGGTFRDCPQLEEVVVRGRSIGERVFVNCPRLQSLRMERVLLIGNYVFSGTTPAERSQEAEDLRRKNLFREFYEVEMDGTRWTSIWEERYRAVTTHFAAVADWTVAADEIDQLIFQSDNGIASLGMGGMFLGELRELPTATLGSFCNDLARLLRAQELPVNEIVQARTCFFEMAGNGQGNPILVFNRIIVGLAPDRFVPIPNMRDMNTIFTWFVSNHFIPGGQIEEGDDFTQWLQQASLVRNFLGEVLPDKNLYQQGIFVWTLFRQEHEETEYGNAESRQERAREIARLGNCGDPQHQMFNVVGHA